MNQLVESFRDSQNALLSALDGHDSEAIFSASRDLSTAASRLNAVNAADLDPAILPMISEIDSLMQASIYRLRFLRDHSSTRLQLLSGWRDGRSATYSNLARGA